MMIKAPAGPIEGLIEDDIAKFRGIRYAQPPIGERRFMPPEPMPAATDTIKAHKNGNRNFQLGLIEWMYNGNLPTEPESEDCLFLNISAPQDTSSPKPVLVWIHGGAFISGSGGEYDPTRLVQDNDVVVVTINYRLGIFGFLDLQKLGPAYEGSANLGIQDQVLALQWVQDNIAAFGGDPTNVTIFGESAGGASVFSLLGTPSAKGLFHKAMPFSGAEIIAPPFDQFGLIKQYLGCEDDQDCLNKLMAMTGEELFAFQQQARFYANPSVDGKVITMPACEAIKTGLSAHIPVLSGATQDEGTLLAPLFAIEEQAAMATVAGLSAVIGRDTGEAYGAYLQKVCPGGSAEALLTHGWYDIFRASALRVASTASQYGAGGWVFNFEVETDHPLGITHFADVPFTFNWIEENHPRLFVHKPTAENQALADKWSRTVAEFAKSGNPNGHGLPDWPTYRPDGFDCLRVCHAPEIVSNPDGDMLQIYKVS